MTTPPGRHTVDTITSDQLDDLQDQVEGHRLALSVALGLGTGAPWTAIHERVHELRRLAGEQHTPDEVETAAPAEGSGH